MLIDEADLRDTSLVSTLVKALNVGFDALLGYITKCDKDDPDNVESFCVFGPKLAATRYQFNDDALESRFITTRAHKQPHARFLGTQFETEAASLRNKLLLWRLRNYERAKERAKMLEDPEIHRTVFGSRPIDPRIAQILLPIAHAFRRRRAEGSDNRAWGPSDTRGRERGRVAAKAGPQRRCGRRSRTDRDHTTLSARRAFCVL